MQHIQKKYQNIEQPLWSKDLLYLARQDEEMCVRDCTSARIIRISRYVLRLNSSSGC